MILFLIFDVGNTCYPYTLNPLNAYCREKTRNPGDFDAKNGVKSFDYDPFMKGLVDYDGFCEALCAHCEMPCSAQIKAEINVAMHAGVGDFYPQTLAVIDKAKQLGVRVGLLSNALPNLYDTAARLVDKENAFVSYELGLLKPDKAIYRAVLEKVNVPAGSVVFIDDKVKNVAAAKAVGMQGIVFRPQRIERDFGAILALQCNYIIRHQRGG